MTEPVTEPTPQDLLDVVYNRLALHAAIYRGTNAGGILKAALADTMRHTRDHATTETVPLAELTLWAQDEAERRITEALANPRNAVFLG